MKSARETLRFPTTRVYAAIGNWSGASRYSHQRSEPTYGHNASTKELPPAPEPASPRWGSVTSCGRSQGRPKRSVFLHSDL
jgi:hypothetical protein